MAPTMPKTKGQKSKPRTKKLPKVEVSEEDRQPGVVYLGHIPHGFYEREINDYFSQFGKVLDIKLSRSKKTGNSKGYAFIKFRYAAVAKTVAETCHNYLFFNKLLQCEYKPMSEVHPETFFRYHMTPNTKPKRLHNRSQDDVKIKSAFKEMLGKQKKKISKLQKLGLDVDLDGIVEINKSRLPEEIVKQPSDSEEETVSETLETSKAQSTKSKTSLKSANQSAVSKAPNAQPMESKDQPKATKKSKKQAVSEKLQASKTTKQPSQEKTVPEAPQPQLKSAQPILRTSKRKADAIEEDKPSTVSENKISPAAKRLKRSVKNSSPLSQTKGIASQKKKIVQSSRKK